MFHLFVEFKWKTNVRNKCRSCRQAWEAASEGADIQRQRTDRVLREYALIDPSDRRVEVFTRAAAGAWMLVDQTQADTLTLSSIGLALPMAAVFKGVEQVA